MYLKLRSMRLKRGYTLSYMAENLGISNPFYSQIESGKRKLSYDMAVKISKIFNSTPDLIFYEDHKKLLK